MVSSAVAEELRAGKTGRELSKCRRLEFNENRATLQIEGLGARFPYLGAGEISVLAWGLHDKGEKREYLCVLDDRRARQAAAKLDLSLKGTVGLLRELNDRGFVSVQEREALEKTLVDAGFWFKEG